MMPKGNREARKAGLDGFGKRSYGDLMETISVSELKAHLSAELRKVEGGTSVVVLDHRRPVARLEPLAEPSIYLREARAPYAWRELAPLVESDPLDRLLEERGER